MPMISELLLCNFTHELDVLYTQKQSDVLHNNLCENPLDQRLEQLLWVVMMVAGTSEPPWHVLDAFYYFTDDKDSLICFN